MTDQYIFEENQSFIIFNFVQILQTENLITLHQSYVVCDVK